MKYFSQVIKPIRLNALAFYSLLGSGAYIILLWSPNILGKHVGLWTQITIFVLPWLMVWLTSSWETITKKEYRFEIILIVSIILLGVLNTVWSDNPDKSLDSMRTFELTGIFALWASMFLLTDRRRRDRFDWFCGACLGIIASVELLGFWVRGYDVPSSFQIFSLHPIPLGTLLILLSPGPIHLIRSTNFGMRLSGWLLVLLSGSIIALSEKRGTVVALGVMFLAWLGYHYRRRRYLILTALMITMLILPIIGMRLAAHLDPKIPSDSSILQRLELYPFAWHVWQSHPVMGIGLRPYTHQKYLVDYQQHDQDLGFFPQTVTSLQTFENMTLTGFVELGTVMMLAYLGLVIAILTRYCRTLRSQPESPPIDWYRVLVLIGFAVHSLSYDSLLFPPVSWLFHVQLGIMAGYTAPERGGA